MRLDVFDLLGQRVRTLVDGRQMAGAHEIAWDGRDDGKQWCLFLPSPGGQFCPGPAHASAQIDAIGLGADIF